jgi:hypothetical protein
MGDIVAMPIEGMGFAGDIIPGPCAPSRAVIVAALRHDTSTAPTPKIFPLCTLITLTLFLC